MTRRELLWLAGVSLTGETAPAQDAAQNLSYPLRSIEGAATTPDLLFVRDHFQEPAIALENWALRIGGAVQRPYELSFADLVELPGRKVEAVLECAGNGANGSAVSSGLWEGVSLSALLENARPAADASTVLLEGADEGQLFEDRPALPYSQLVPLAKCQNPDSLIAYKYNDATLPKRNGFPARALFPGWYGMNSVKWLTRVTLLRAGHPASAFTQSGMDRLYNRETKHNGADRVERLSALQLKSVMAWPTDRLRLPEGRHLVWGFAWSGSGPVRQVTVSSDGGKTWSPAKLNTHSGRYAWVRWSYAWNATPGDHLLLSRAVDASGNQQPLLRDPARKDAYELNWCRPVACSVF